MGLWFEHRDEKGNLADRGRFQSGSVEMLHLVEIHGDGSTSAASFSLKEAMALAKPSAHLPVEKRDWALRISFDDDASV